jgi:hypothetical protein
LAALSLSVRVVFSSGFMTSAHAGGEAAIARTAAPLNRNTVDMVLLSRALVSARAVDLSEARRAAHPPDRY